MKKSMIAGLLAALLAIPAAFASQNDSKVTPEKWLQQLNGEWEADSEMVIGPGTPAVKARVAEKVRSVGAWMIAENEVKMPGFNVTGIMTVGYDPEKKKF